MLATGITRIIGSYLSSSIRPMGPSAPARPSTRTMHRVDLLVPGSMESMARLLFPQHTQPEYNAWVSVVEEKQRGDTWVSFLEIISYSHVLLISLLSHRPSASFLEYWSSMISPCSIPSAPGDRFNNSLLPSLPSIPETHFNFLYSPTHPPLSQHLDSQSKLTFDKL